MLHTLLATIRTRLANCFDDPVSFISTLLFIFGITLLAGVFIYELLHKKSKRTENGEIKLPQPKKTVTNIQKDNIMFCKKCGKQIDNDSTFCQYCGSKQAISTPTDQPFKNETIEQTQSSGIATFFIVTIIIILIAFCAIFCIQQIKENNSSKNNSTQSSQKSENKIFSRNAKNSDIYIDAEYSFPVSINLIIRPYKDIDNLEITIEYLNKAGETIKIQQKTIGNVKEGQEYRIQINLSDFSFSQIWNMESCAFTVSNGTVKLLD